MVETRWYHLIAYFFGGAFLMNSVPHLVAGVSGSPFQSPFATPPGEGLSSPTVNVLWAAFNLLVAYLLVCRVGRFELRRTTHVIAFALGALLMGLMLARTFGRVMAALPDDLSRVREMRMARPRSMTFVLIAIVALAGANRALLQNGDLFRLVDLTGFVLSGLILQAGFVAMAVCRGRARLFWAGFEAAGFLVLLGYELSMVLSPNPLGPSCYHAWGDWVLKSFSLTFYDLFDYFQGTNLDPSQETGVAVCLLPAGSAGGVAALTAGLLRSRWRGHVSPGPPDQPLTLPKNP